MRFEKIASDLFFLEFLVAAQDEFPIRCPNQCQISDLRLAVHDFSLPGHSTARRNKTIK
jgi:hypothetical protein